MTWNIKRTSTLTRKDIQDLFENRVGAIIIPHFLKEKVCGATFQRLLSKNFQYYIDGNIGKIGIDQYSFNQNSKKKQEYFSKVPEAERVRKNIFKDVEDPVEKIMDLFSKIWPKRVSLAYEKNQPYFAGDIRTIRLLLLHTDWAPLYAQGWSIEKITGQLSWNLFLKSATQGGQVVIFQRQWQPEDEKYNLHPEYQNYGYSVKVVKDCEKVEVKPRQGDLVLFNTKNYHYVKKAKGKRITITSFIGRKHSNEIVFWS